MSCRHRSNADVAGAGLTASYNGGYESEVVTTDAGVYALNVTGGQPGSRADGTVLIKVSYMYLPLPIYIYPCLFYVVPFVPRVKVHLQTSCIYNLISINESAGEESSSVAMVPRRTNLHPATLTRPGGKYNSDICTPCILRWYMFIEPLAATYQ